MKKIIVPIISFIIMIAVLITIFFLDKIINIKSLIFGSSKDAKTVYIDGEAYLPKSLYTFLIVGVDEEESTVDQTQYRNSAVADFIAVIVFDKKESKYQIIHINRDTIADYDRLDVNGKKAGTNHEQICLSHCQGSGGKESIKNVRNAVENYLLGVEINYYVSIRMNAIKTLTDYVGGVNITLEDDQDLSVINESWTPSSTIHLNGEDALKFIRARSEVEDGTNVKRMRRQKQFMNAFIDCLNEKSNLSNSFISDGYEMIEQYIITNGSLAHFEIGADYFKRFEYDGFKEPEGTTQVNPTTHYMEFIPDEASLKKMVIEVFYDKRD